MGTVAETTNFAGFKPDGRPPGRIAVLAFDGVVLGDLAVPLEIFGRVQGPDGRPLYEVSVCGTGPEILSRHLALRVASRLASAARAGTIIVPGVEDPRRDLDPRILSTLRGASKRGARIASICTGAFVLAAAGLLDGLRATTHWMAAPELARRYPGIEVDPNVLYVDNGRVLTSAGAAAGMDLCLYMVRRDLGATVAGRVARVAVMPLERSGGQAQFIEYRLPETTDSMRPLVEWMEQNLDRELPLAALARQAGMSTRTLSRRFREQVGMTPARWLLGARVRRAQRLLETTRDSIELVAGSAGFGSTSVLREHFTSAVGVSPSEYRRSFGACDPAQGFRGDRAPRAG